MTAPASRFSAAAPVPGRKQNSGQLEPTRLVLGGALSPSLDGQHGVEECARDLGGPLVAGQAQQLLELLGDARQSVGLFVEHRRHQRHRGRQA